jgi:hypothetical protein
MKTLQELSIGDKVILHQRDCLDCVGTVERTTPTQIIVRGQKYRRSNGDAVASDPFYHKEIRIPKDGEIEQCIAAIRRAKLVRYLSEYPFATVSDTKILEQIKTLLPNIEPK